MTFNNDRNVEVQQCFQMQTLNENGEIEPFSI